MTVSRLERGNGPGRRQGLSRVEIAYRNILALITEGGLGEGARLPSEAEMAKSFGISRPVIRQALSRLKEAGVIEVRWGAGSYVRSNAGAGSDEGLFGPIQSLNEVRYIYELRFALEGEAAALAARRRAPIEAIRRAFDALDEAQSRRTLGLVEDVAFHLAIAAASQNPYFGRVLQSIRQALEFSINLTRILSVTHPEEQLRIVQREHLAVMEAIAAGDPDAARAAMHQHIDGACKRIFEGPAKMS